MATSTKVSVQYLEEEEEEEEESVDLFVEVILFQGPIPTVYLVSVKTLQNLVYL